MQSKILNHFCASLNVLIVIGILLIVIGMSRSPFAPKPAEENDVISSSKESLCWGKISDYLICGDRLFVLYGDKRVMQCYDLNGAFLCSYTFGYAQRGRPELHTDGTKLWVEGGPNNFFEFSSSGDFLTFYDYIEEKENLHAFSENFLSQEDAHTTEDGGYVTIRGASIWRVSADEREERIVSRPIWLVIYQKNCIFFITLILFFIRWLIAWFQSSHYRNKKPVGRIKPNA